MTYLVAYDIARPKRLRKVAALMEGYGVRVQKSVFECVLKGAELRKMTKEIEALIDPTVDAVRIYPLFGRARERQTILGIGAENLLSEMCYVV